MMYAIPQNIPWLGVIVATVSAFVLGGIWYGPLFKNAWCRENGVDPDAKPKNHPGMVFGIAILCAFLAALMFSLLLPGDVSVANGLMLGFVVGVFFVAMSFGINYAFAQRSMTLWMIDAGYHIIQFCLYGVIIAALS